LVVPPVWWTPEIRRYRTEIVAGCGVAMSIAGLVLLGA
jgi:hypothetical protein